MKNIIKMMVLLIVTLLFGTAPVVLADSNLALYPESPHLYESEYASYSSTYTHPESAEALMITFNEQTRIADQDSIFVYDANQLNANYHGDGISGSPFKGSELAGKTIAVLGNTFKIVLRTYGRGSFYGYKVIDITSTSAYTIQTTVGGTGGGSVESGEEQYPAGDSATVKAKPSSGFIMEGWYENSILLFG